MSKYYSDNQCIDEDYGEELLHDTLRLFETEAVLFAKRFIKDANVRIEYIEKAKQLSEEYMGKLRRGRISPKEAAKQVNLLRNEIMELARIKSSDIAKAAAVKLKVKGKSLAELCKHYAQKLYKKDFTFLTAQQRNQVYKEIVKSAGRTRPSVNAKLTMMSRAGKGLFALSIGIAAYNILTAEDKLKATGKEGVVVGSGFLGGAAGGAAAGLVCGPGAPVCVTIGVFVGGILGSIGGDLAFESLF